MSDICLTCKGMIFTIQDGPVGYVGPICQCIPAPRYQIPASLKNFLIDNPLSLEEMAIRLKRMGKERDLYREALKKIKSLDDDPLGIGILTYEQKLARDALEKGDKIRDGSAS